jgi:hypothetical protein
MSTAGLGNIYDGSMGALTILGETSDRDNPRRASWKEVGQDPKKQIEDMKKRALVPSVPPPDYTPSMSTRKDDDSQNTKRWIRYKS